MKEYATFKLWASVAKKAMEESGVERDECVDKVELNRR